MTRCGGSHCRQSPTAAAGENPPRSANVGRSLYTDPKRRGSESVRGQPICGEPTPLPITGEPRPSTAHHHLELPSRSGTARTRLAGALVEGRMHAAAYCDDSEYHRITKQDSGHRAENNAVVRDCDQSAHRERHGARDSTRLPQPAITPHARTVTERLPSTESATVMACVTAGPVARNRSESAWTELVRVAR